MFFIIVQNVIFSSLLACLGGMKSYLKKVFAQKSHENGGVERRVKNMAHG